MCGIVGVVTFDGQSDPQILEQMIYSIAHRGPDDQSTITVGPVGLGSARLSIVDVSTAGHQPMRHQKCDWWIAYNGEIFNHQSLRSQLPPYLYAGQSDTETLLHLLVTRGMQSLDLCDGFFAFAALNVAKRQLFLVRDRFGVKPLYIARLGNSLLFASEIQAILAAGFPAHVNLDAFKHHLLHRWVNGRDTLIEGVQRVLPGTFLCVDLDTAAIAAHVWYEPADEINAALALRLSHQSRAQLAQQLEEFLHAAVRSRLLADVSIGTLCSGGLDSGLVTALAARDKTDMVAYSAAIPEQPQLDESKWAELMCNTLRIPLRKVPITLERWKSSFVQAVKHFEYPLVHESSVALAMIAAQASTDGIKVLMGGEASDELFGGYSSRHPNQRITFASSSQIGWDNASVDSRATSSSDPLAGLLGSTSFKSVQEYEDGVLSQFYAAYAHHEYPRRLLETAIAADLRIFLSHGLQRLDKNMMQYSVEVREPFLSPQIVSFALNLPLEMRILPRVKGILLDVGSKFLPELLLSRPKVGFSFATASYFEQACHNTLLNGYLRDILAVDLERWQPFVLGATGSRVLRLWSAEVWCRIMLGGESVDQVEAKIWKQ